MNCRCGVLLYPDEHISCVHYSKEGNSLVEILDFSKGDVIERMLCETEIGFILKGRLSISLKDIKNCSVGAEKIILLPVGTQVRAEAQESGRLFICRLKYTAQLCESFRLEHLYEYIPNLNTEIKALDFNDPIRNFLDNFITRINDGLRCTHYIEIKLSEFLFLLRGYYTKEELAGFFYLLLSSDIGFRNIVLRHYSDVRKVKNFAEIANYSQAGFHKRFKKVFGVTPSQWMYDHKANQVRSELVNTQKPLKEISEKFEFSSVSHFNKFCKRHFKSTPLQVRNGR